MIDFHFDVRWELANKKKVNIYFSKKKTIKKPLRKPLTFNFSGTVGWIILYKLVIAASLKKQKI